MSKMKISSLFPEPRYGPLVTIQSYLSLIEVVKQLSVCQAFYLSGRYSLRGRRIPNSVLSVRVTLFVIRPREEFLGEILRHGVFTEKFDLIFEYVCRRGYLKILDDFFSISSKYALQNLLKKDITKAFSDACRFNRVNVVRRLFQMERGSGKFKCVSYREKIESLMTNVAMNGRAKLLKVLCVDHRFNPNYQDGMALRQATKNGEFGIVKLLIEEYGLDESESNNQTIRLACKYGHMKIVTYLLNDPDRFLRIKPGIPSAIADASKSGHKEIVELLLRTKFTCNEKVVDDMKIAIAKSARNGYFDILRLLLTHEKLKSCLNNNSWALQKVLTEVCRSFCKFRRDSKKLKEFKSQRRDMVEFLLRDERVNPIQDDCQALRVSIMQGKDDLVSILMKFKPPNVSLSKEKSYAMLFQKKENYQKIVKLIPNEK